MTIKIGGISIGMGVNLATFEKNLSQAQRRLKKFSRDVGNLGSSLTKAISLPLAGIGTAAVIAGRDFDQALATIRRGTGATGKALEDLDKSFKKVFKENDDSIAEVSQTIADLNTRTGLVGAPLEKLASTLLDLADVTGSDLKGSVEGATRLFGDWAIATDDQTGSLDLLFRTSQSTGIEINKLMSTLVSYGAPLRALGFSLDEAAALLGKFEKEGVNTEAVLGGLKQGLGRLIRAGVDPAQAFRQLIAEFKTTQDEALLTERALKIFGSRAVVDMSKAIAEGRFEISGLVSELQNSDETIAKAAKESETFTQKLQKLGNIAKTALNEFGTPILTAAIPHLERITKIASEMGQRFSELTPSTKNLVLALGGIAIVAGPLLVALAAVTKALALLLAPKIIIIGGLVAIVSAVYVFRDEIASAFKSVVTSVSNSITQLGQRIALGASFIKTLALEVGKKLSPFHDSRLNSSSKEPFFNQAALLTYQDNLKNIEALAAKIKTSQTGSNEAQEGGATATEKFKEKIAGLKTETADLAKQLGLTGDSTTDFEIDLDSLGKGGAASAKNELENLQKTLVDLKQTIKETALKNAIDDAIKSGNEASFGALKTKFLEASREGILAGLDASVQNTAAAKEYSDLLVGQLESELDTSYKNGMIEAHKSAVEAWRSTFENAITGVKFDLKDALQQVAVGFAAELAASFTNLPAGVSSPQDFGGFLGSILTSGGAPGQDPLQGPLTQSQAAISSGLGVDGSTLIGLEQAANGAGTSYAINNAIKGISQLGKSSRETAKGIGTLGGGALGYALGGPIGAAIGTEIGEEVGRFAAKAFGLGGPTNKETLSRLAFGDQLNKLLKEVGGLNITGSDGGAVNLSQIDIFGGNSKFNDGKGFEFLNSLDDKARGVFSSLGLAFKEVFELDDLPAEQAAAILSENFLGSIDNARLAVQTLGLDFETLKGKILDTALKGQIDWLEFNSTVRDLGEAFEPGRAAFADVAGAIDDFRNSAARGIKATKGIRDIAQELIEAGANDLDSGRQKLIEMGVSVEEANQIIAAFAGRGVSSLQEVASASDEFAGSIAGDLKAAGFGFVELTEDVIKVKDALEQINKVSLAAKELKVNIVATGRTDLLEGTPISVSAPEVSAPVTSTPETARSLQVRGNARGNVAFNIDARGADSGAESRILNALSTFEERAVNSAVNVIFDMQQRGQL